MFEHLVFVVLGSESCFDRRCARKNVSYGLIFAGF